MRLWFLVAAAVVCASCAGTTAVQPYPGLESYGPDVALVHFLRKNSGYGAALAAAIEIDGHPVGGIGPGGALAARIPARQVTISTSGGSVVLNAKKGQEYYYEIRLPFHGMFAMDEFEISPISAQQARALGLE